ncbi:translation initiation factor IF-2-like [Salvia hispanica]|uniref:translation initiation factor IF-2-like n=1 Tax=Salvia hispanica TaxID=49212 RepID=UPI0020094089|nr:translation initiation factor IF-2-like [Salvia hispanica]
MPFSPLHDMGIDLGGDDTPVPGHAGGEKGEKGKGGGRGDPPEPGPGEWTEDESPRWPRGGWRCRRSGLRTTGVCQHVAKIGAPGNPARTGKGRTRRSGEGGGAHRAPGGPFLGYRPPSVGPNGRAGGPGGGGSVPPLGGKYKGYLRVLLFLKDRRSSGGGVRHGWRRARYAGTQRPADPASPDLLGVSIPPPGRPVRLNQGARRFRGGSLSPPEVDPRPPTPPLSRSPSRNQRGSDFGS